MSSVYSPQFWARAYELASVGAKKCEQCKLYQCSKPGERVTVRVVLTEAGKPMPHKLRLMCTKCFPDAREFKLPRKQILAKVGDLFEHAPDKARTVNGR